MYGVIFLYFVYFRPWRLINLRSLKIGANTQYPPKINEIMSWSAVQQGTVTTARKNDA